MLDTDNKIVGFYGNNKFDLIKNTNEEYEVYCWYNSISIFILFSVVIIPMIYTVKHKMKKNLILILFYLSNYLINKK